MNFQTDTTFTSFGGTDVFLLKLLEDGSFDWAKQAGANVNDFVFNSIAIGNEDSIYIAGGFRNTLEIDGSTITCTDLYDIFLAKFTADGELTWLKQIGTGTSNEISYDIEVDNSNNIIMCGFYKTILEFENDTLHGNAFVNNFYAKFDANGNELWAKNILGTSNSDRIVSVADFDYGYIFGGYFLDSLFVSSDTITSSNGSAEFVIFKTDFLGNVQWIRRSYGGSNDVISEITCNENGDVFVAGYYNSTNLQIDSTATIVSTQSISNTGGADIIVYMMTTNGNLSWLKTAGSIADDIATGITYNDGIILASGQFQAFINFNDNTLTSNGATDAFAVAYNSSGQYLYSNSIGGTVEDKGISNAITSNGSFLVAGTFKSANIDFNSNSYVNPNPGTEDAFIAKFGTINLDFVVTNDSCNSGGTGAIDLTVSGDARPPYTYIWDDPSASTTEDVSGLAAGWYTVTMTDVNGAIKIDSAYVDEPEEFQTLFSNTNASCGGGDGAIDLLVTGGTAPYTYNWSDAGGSTTQDISGLDAGSYTVTITDALGCSTIETTTVNVTNALNLTLIADNETCGQNDGSIDLTVDGASGSETYLWNNSATTQDISSLSSGTYSVTVTDGACTKTGTVAVGETVGPTAIANVTNPSCSGGDGEINLVPSSGIPPYTFLWDDAGNSTTEDLSGLDAGIYNVIVTDDNGCTTTATASLTTTENITVTAQPTAASCGNDDGAVNLTISGASGSEAYNWSNGETTQNITGLYAGNYSVTVTDGNCTEITTVIVLNSDGPSASVYETQPTCAANDGAINLVPSGGTTPYSFQWDDASLSTSEDISGLGAGTYSVTITDNTGCSTTASSILSIDGSPEIDFLSSDATCGNINGTIDLIVTGASGSETYNWSNSETTQDLSGLTAGIYSVTVTDGNCTASVSVAVGNTSGPTASIYASNPSCTGADGAINLVPSGGGGGYTFEWDDASNSTTEDLSGLDAGTFNVTVTDANSCTTMASATISTPNSPGAIAIGTNPSCTGADGEIDLTVSGGLAPYAYNWNTTDTDQDLSGLDAGTFNVTVTDANNCTTTASTNLETPDNPTAVYVTTNPSCTGADGEIDLTISGGSAPYSYNWSNSTTDQDLSGLDAGAYAVTITDANNCTTTTTASLVNPSQPVVIVDVTNPSCTGADGEVNVSVYGGTSPYSYIWNTTDTDQDITGLDAGTYAVTVTDANNCTSEVSANLVSPTNPTLNLYGSDPSCLDNDGSINLIASGGASPYAYNWDIGETTEDVSGLSAGSYSVTLTDANNCSSIGSIELALPDGTSISFINSDPSCAGNDGSIDLLVNGGASSYSYNWSNTETTEDITALSSGTYSITVTDANNCEVTGSTVLNPSTAPELVLVPTSPTSGNNGSINLVVVGGESPFTYVWDNAETTEDITGLSVGWYIVTVTDNNSCVAIDSVELTSGGGQSTTDLFAYLSGSDPDCPGDASGSINTTVTGGTQPYSFVWSGGETTQNISGLVANTYIVTISDAGSQTYIDSITLSNPAEMSVFFYSDAPDCYNGTNGSAEAIVFNGQAPYSYTWSSGDTDQNATNLASGYTYLTVTDNNACTINDSINLNNPAQVLTDVVVENNPCAAYDQGEADLSIYNGTAPYTYNWSNGSSTQDIDNLTADTYYVTITDANGCEAIDSATITDPTGMSITLLATDASCQGINTGSIDATVTGGSTPYTFNWDDALNSTSEDISSLATGTYTLTVTDANGCSMTESATVNAVSALSLTLSPTQPTCNGIDDGSINAGVLDGVEPYSFQWSNGETTQNISNLSAGDYSLTVTDFNGCSINGNNTLSNSTGLSITLTTTDPTCFGLDNGTIEATVTGGSSPYTYLWNDENNQTDASASDLSEGTYTITVTDDNGCYEVDSASINNTNQLEGNVTVTAPYCTGKADGSLTTTVSNGTSPYAYSWSNGETTSDLESLDTGTYSVTITDDNNCQDIVTVLITPTVEVSLNVVSSDPQCYGLSTGNITVSPVNTVSPVTYEWSNGATSQNLQNIVAGTYTLIATDDSSCVASAEVTLTEPEEILASINSVTPQCSGQNTGSALASISGGVEPYSYTWKEYNNADSTAIDTDSLLENISAGTYYLWTLDDNNCMSLDSVTITDPVAISANNNSSEFICSGELGSIDLSVSGGTEPYSFSWSNGLTESQISGLSADTYSYTVTDANACTYESNIELVESTEITIEDSVNMPACFGMTNGSLYLDVTGGVSPYTYDWTIDGFSSPLV
ncbi:MAG: hypothetical protein C0594_12555, partial [Marinilabiliales bacterium]